MKSITFTLFALLLFQLCHGQQAVQIPAYAKENKPIAWYKEQVKAWEKVLQKEPKNANAWYNYFKANRILVFHDHEVNRPEDQKDAQLKDVVDRMGKVIPDSYEYNFCQWQLGGNDMKYYPFLEKAIAIDPNRNEHIDYMVNIGELERDAEKRNEFSLKKLKAGLISSGMMYYNYNMISGLEQHAILLTSGDNDTYPSWALQAMGTRPDVTVLNLYLLHLKDYREKVFAELGVAPIELNTKEIEDEFFKKQLVQHLSENKKQYPVYLALTSAGCSDMVEIENNLYLTGLAYQYHKGSFDNLAILKKNFEKQYALDYIDKPYYDEISVDLVKRVNQNYIVPMLKLYQHYTASGDLQKQQWIKEKLIYISRGTEEEQSVLKYLD